MILESQKILFENRTNKTKINYLTQADINIMKLVDETQKKLKIKKYEWGQLEKYGRNSKDPKTREYIINYINGEKTKKIKFDQRILGIFILK